MTSTTVLGLLRIGGGGVAETSFMSADRLALVLVAAGCLAAGGVWFRSTKRLRRVVSRLQGEVLNGRASEDSLELARSSWRKDFHTAVLYGILAFSAAATAVLGRTVLGLPLFLVLVPAVFTVRFGNRFSDTARLAEQRSQLERRAEEVLAQKELAPMAWAARLAPPQLPDIQGFEIGQVYQPGAGAMAGDFYDVSLTAPTRLATVIGDVTGHGIEASITAFQVKYLLRVLLRQYRDPAQALEELNAILYTQGRPEEFVSLCLVVFDMAAGTLRFASAGHPPAWLWHDGEVLPLRSTGPLLALDPKAGYLSREVPLDPGDLLLLYTDGLTEARSGGAMFGEERIASMLRRDPVQEATALCKSLLAAAQDFASGPLMDDVAIVAVRRR
ncbi:MAG: PP2C family protein-serine/threonine phosphatase [Actinomycetota bacterium]|nr:PP2C family protein-serine/threonine phosphatase [Actinomycetota bacterium]